MVDGKLNIRIDCPHTEVRSDHKKQIYRKQLPLPHQLYFIILIPIISIKKELLSSTGSGSPSFLGFRTFDFFEEVAFLLPPVNSYAALSRLNREDC